MTITYETAIALRPWVLDKKMKKVRFSLKWQVNGIIRERNVQRLVVHRSGMYSRCHHYQDNEWLCTSSIGGLVRHKQCTYPGYEFYSCFLLLESIEVTIKPKPNPESMLPTNARADSLRKKNPTPRPRSRPPPIAHVLLSSFLSAIQSSLFPSSITAVLIFLRTTPCLSSRNFIGWPTTVFYEKPWSSCRLPQADVVPQ